MHLPAARTVLRAARVAPRDRSAKADASRRVQDLLFAAALVVCAVGHWVVLAQQSGPSGLDLGNWLGFGHALLGENVRSSGLVYPPLVPLLAVTAVHVLGLMNADHALAVMAGAAPAVGVYVLLRQAGAGWTAPTLAGIIAGASSTGEAAAWAGYPQLLALGFLCLLLVCWDSHLRSGSRRAAIGAALSLVGTMASNELIGVAGILLVAAVLGAHLLVRPHEILAGWRRHAACLAGIVLATTPLLPTYVTLVRAARQQAASVPPPPLRLDNVVGWVNVLYRDFPLFWQIALLMAAIAPLALWRHRRHPLWIITTSLAVVTAALIVLTRESRYVYLLPTLAVCGVALWTTCARIPRLSIRATEWTRLVAALALVGVLCLQIVRGLSFFPVQVSYYTVINPGLLAGLDWLRTETPPGTLVAVTDTRRGDPLGWWVEGYAERPALYIAPNQYLIYSDERDRAAVASEIFGAKPPLSGVCTDALSHGVHYLFIDKGWADSTGFSSALSSTGGAQVILDNQALLLVRCSA